MEFDFFILKMPLHILEIDMQFHPHSFHIFKQHSKFSRSFINDHFPTLYILQHHH